MTGPEIASVAIVSVLVTGGILRISSIKPAVGGGAAFLDIGIWVVEREEVMVLSVNVSLKYRHTCLCRMFPN